MISKVITLAKRNVERMINTQRLEQEIDSNSWALISIYANNDVLANINSREVLTSLGCKDFMSAQFHDITDEDKIKIDKAKDKENEYILFNESHAKEIINFIDKVKDKVNLLVTQCAAGISRSGAIGAFVCRYLNLNEAKYQEENNVLPNMYILKVLTDCSGMNDGYIEFWEKQREINPELAKRLDSLFR